MNPVLDATVALFITHLQQGGTFDFGDLAKLHAAVLDMASKEPGGLRYAGGAESVNDE